MATSKSKSVSTSSAISSTCTRGLLMILSPAKTLNLTPLEEEHLHELSFTEPSCNPENTKLLATILKSKSTDQLSKLLGTSAKLSQTVKEYWSDFELDPQNAKMRKPALFSFDGPAYKGIHPETCTNETISYLQSNLRIIDPCYGELKPLDLIQPYRLEMATKNVLPATKMKDHKSLASWWSSSVTNSIIDELNARDKITNEDNDKNSNVVLNLASDEYSAVMDQSQLQENGVKFVKVVFQQEGRVIAVHAKRARGLMARYVAENAALDLDVVKGFDSEGYAFVPSRSSDGILVFDRKKPDGKGSSTKRKVDEKKTTGKKTRKSR